MSRPYHFTLTQENGDIQLYQNGKTGKPTPVKTFKGHEGRVFRMNILQDERLVSWSDDTTIRIWEWSGECEVLRGHTQLVWDVMQLEDGRIVSCSDDTTLRVWTKTKEGWTSQVLRGHEDAIWGIGGHNHQIVSWSEDCTIRIWTETLEGWQAVHVLRHDGPVRQVILLSSGRMISVPLSGAQCWICTETPNGWVCDVKRLYKHHKQKCFACFRNLLLSCAGSQTIRIWREHKTSRGVTFKSTLLRAQHPVNSVHIFTEDQFASKSKAGISIWVKSQDGWSETHLISSGHQDFTQFYQTWDGYMFGNHGVFYHIQHRPRRWSRRAFKRHRSARSNEWITTGSYEGRIIQGFYTKQDIQEWHAMLCPMPWLLKELWRIVAEY